jgi:hypothetical protein
MSSLSGGSRALPWTQADQRGETVRQLDDLPTLRRLRQQVGVQLVGALPNLRMADYILSEVMIIAMSDRVSPYLADVDPREFATDQVHEMLPTAGLSAASAERMIEATLTKLRANGSLQYLCDVCEVTFTIVPEPHTGAESK